MMTPFPMKKTKHSFCNVECKQRWRNPCPLEGLIQHCIVYERLRNRRKIRNAFVDYNLVCT